MASPDGDLPDVEVDPKQLEDYASYLNDKQAFPAEVKNLVAQSDVSNESWGLIGLATKEDYVDLLHQLQDRLDDMKDGLQSAAEKFTLSAKEYRESEARGEQTFKSLLDEWAPCQDPDSTTGNAP